MSTPLISDFSAGELSPDLYGQSGKEVYYKGASRMLNTIPKAAGGFFKRPGTLVCGHTQGDASARLISFVVSENRSYVLEFTNNLIRVWKDGVWMGVATNIATTYTTAEIPDIQVAPCFPDLFITHHNHPPARIRWTTPDTLTLSALTFRTNTLAFTGDVTSGTNTILNVVSNNLPAESIWLLSGTGITAGTYITAVAGTSGSSPLTYTVTISVNATATNAGVALTLTLQPIPFAAAGEYPSSCAVLFQRLWLSSLGNYRQRMYQSIVGIYDPTDPVGTVGLVGMAWSDISTYSVPRMKTNADGTPTTNPPSYIDTVVFQDLVNDADAGMYVLNSETSDEIYWLAGVKDIIVGSSSGEWFVSGTANPNSMSAEKISSVTDSPIRPMLVSDGLILVQKLGRRVYRLQWQGTGVPYTPPVELTFFAEHMFINNPITASDIQSAPDCLLWYVRTDGSAGVLLYNTSYGVMAWWNFVTTGVINSICVVPGVDMQGVTDRDVVYLCVTRGASTYIEQVATPYWSDNRRAVFSDCATYRYNAVKFSTMAVDVGLNGTTLEVVADGAYIGTAVPAAGVLTLPGGISANYVVAGINFTSQVTSMPLLAQAQDGSSQLMKTSLPKCRFRVYNTLYMKAGQFTAATAGGMPGMSTVRMGDTGVDYTKANPVLYSGFCRTSILEALRDDCFLNIISNLPLPMNVTAIVPDVETMETSQ
jgi:hypothetical protein